MSRTNKSNKREIPCSQRKKNLSFTPYQCAAISTLLNSNQRPLLESRWHINFLLRFYIYVQGWESTSQQALQGIYYDILLQPK
jgi:hypothetical protein